MGTSSLSVQHAVADSADGAATLYASGESVLAAVLHWDSRPVLAGHIETVCGTHSLQFVQGRHTLI